MNKLESGTFIYKTRPIVSLNEFVRELIIERKTRKDD